MNIVYTNPHVRWIFPFFDFQFSILDFQIPAEDFTLERYFSCVQNAKPHYQQTFSAAVAAFHFH